MKRMWKNMAVGAALGLLATSCGSEDAGGAEVLPDVSPINLGQLWPLAGNEAEPGSNERTPYEFVLLLRSTGETTLHVDRACLVGDDTNWIIEGPVPMDIYAGEKGAVRLSFERQNPGREVLAVVVESDADNFPQLVIPLCAEVVADGSEKNVNVQPCELTIDIPENPCG